MNAKTASSVVNKAFYARTCQGEHYSGDLIFIKEHDAKVFVAIVDAAGHGSSAHRIAIKVEKILSSENTDDLVALVQSIHRQLKDCSGAVIITGIFDTESLEFSFIHIGDVHGKMFGPRHRTLLGQAGMLGQAIPQPIIRSEMLSVGDTLVLCTDGISERYDLNEIQAYRNFPTDALARRIVEQFGKDHDDASCFVLRCL